MSEVTAMHQLGQFIVRFQNLERLVNDILIHLSEGIEDSEIVTILVHELEFGKRVNTADVLFSYIISTRFPNKNEWSDRFHKLAEQLIELSKLRNKMVHGQYSLWTDIEGRKGLIRSDSQLKPSKRARIDTDVDLLPEHFDEALEQMIEVAERLQIVRTRIVEFMNPD